MLKDGLVALIDLFLSNMAFAYGAKTLKVQYRNLLASLGSGDGQVELASAIPWGTTTKRYLQLCQVNMSKYVANVLNIGPSTTPSCPFAWNNTRIRWTSDSGATWINIDLPAGCYTLDNVQQAIVAGSYTLHTNPGNPAFFLGANTATGRPYVVINYLLSTVGTNTLGLDFSSDTSSPNIAEFLGFNTAPGAATFITNGVYNSVTRAQLNLVGDSISVMLTGFGTLGNVGGQQTHELCTVPMIAFSPTANEFVHPLVPFQLPPIMVDAAAQIKSYTVSFVGSSTRNGQPWPVFFMEGQVNVVFSLIW